MLDITETNDEARPGWAIGLSKMYLNIKKIMGPYLSWALHHHTHGLLPRADPGNCDGRTCHPPGASLGRAGCVTAQGLQIYVAHKNLRYLYVF
jgi:hypothetical protein